MKSLHQQIKTAQKAVNKAMEKTENFFTPRGTGESIQEYRKRNREPINPVSGEHFIHGYQLPSGGQYSKHSQQDLIKNIAKS